MTPIIKNTQEYQNTIYESSLHTGRKCAGVILTYAHGASLASLLYVVLHVCVCCFVVCGCPVSRRYIDVCYCNMFSVVNVYLDHLKFWVVCLIIEGMSVVMDVMLSLMNVMSPPHALCNLLVRIVVKLCTLGVLTLGVSLVS